MNYDDPESVPAEWEIGDVILGKYQVREVFTGGGMGLVYRVYHWDWQMDLAVKAPRAELFQTALQKENFESEAETWVNLGTHPHIATCYYVRRLGGIPRLFAEFVPGGSLADWIQSGKVHQGTAQEKFARILDIGLQVAWGLHHAHERQLVHQDVKPANVLMMPDGTAKLVDFGLAKARSSIDEVTLGQVRPGQSILTPGSGFLTPEYASPEQAAGQPLSKKSDVWSWALMMLEMMKGERDWSYGQAGAAVLEDFAESGSDYEPELFDLLRQCLSTIPGARPEFWPSVSQACQNLLNRIALPDYRRPLPLLVGNDPASEHNLAISQLDLGITPRLEHTLSAVIKRWPGQWESCLADALIRWRAGEITDLEALKFLTERESADPGFTYAAGLIHAERGDFRNAASLLHEVRESFPTSCESLLSIFEGLVHAEPKYSFLEIPVSSPPFAVGFIESRNSWCVGDRSGCVHFVSTEPAVMPHSVATGGSAITAVVASAASTALALTHDDGSLSLWRVDMGFERVGSFACVSGSSSAAFSPDGEFLAFLSSPQEVKVVHSYTGQVKQKLAGPDGLALLGLTWVWSSSCIVAVSKKNLIIWSPPNFNEACVLDCWGEINYPRSGRPGCLISHPTKNGVYLSQNSERSFRSETLLLDLESGGVLCRLPASSIATREGGQFAFASGLGNLGAPRVIDSKLNRIWHTFSHKNRMLFGFPASSLSKDLAAVPVAELFGEGSNVIRGNPKLLQLDLRNCSEIRYPPYKAPMPVMRPLAYEERARNERDCKDIIAFIRRHQENGDPFEALRLVDEALGSRRFVGNGELFRLRWELTRQIGRRKPELIIQRASIAFCDSFAYIPERNEFLLQAGSCFEIHNPDAPAQEQQGVTEIEKSLGYEPPLYSVPKLFGYSPFDRRATVQHCHPANRIGDYQIMDTHANKSVGLCRECEEALIQHARVGLPYPGIDCVSVSFGIPQKPIYSFLALRFVRDDLRRDSVGEMVKGSQIACLMGNHPVVLGLDSQTRWVTAYDLLSLRHRALWVPELSCRYRAYTLSPCNTYLAAILESGILEFRNWPTGALVGSCALPHEWTGWDDSPVLLQISFDDKLILIRDSERVTLVTTADFEPLWSYGAENRDAYITVDSRFIVIRLAEATELWEIRWHKRENHSENDQDLFQKELLRASRAIAGPRKPGSPEPQTVEPELLKTFFSLRGWPENILESFADVLGTVKESGARSDGELLSPVFEDFELNGQRTFAFFWSLEFFGAKQQAVRTKA
jgi:serine/threonine protein kinase